MEPPRPAPAARWARAPRRGEGHEDRPAGQARGPRPRRDAIGHADASLLTGPTDPDFTHTDPWRVLRIQGEFVDGFDALAEVGPAVAVFGSARRPADDPRTTAARELGRQLAEAGFAVITGGGPGIMEAANRGAAEAGGLSIGCNIELPHEQADNPYVEPLDQLPLLLRAEDDVREVRRGVRHLPRRLRHARRAVRGADAGPDRQGRSFPVVLYGSAYWGGLVRWVQARLLEEGLIGREDLDLLRMSDDPEEIVKMAVGPERDEP